MEINFKDKLSIEIEGLQKVFHDGSSKIMTPVLSNVKLSVNGPSIVSIVGPNGVGKTTFLRLIAGVIEPDEGSILINGIPSVKCRVGYVPQSNPVFPWRRVDDDITIPLEILGVPLNKRRSEAAKIVEQFSLDIPLNKRSYCLSGGQRQMVNICRALVGDDPPKILLLDEPFSSLYFVTKEAFLEQLQKIHDKMKLIVLLTTHQLDFAILFSDIIVPFSTRPVSFTDNDIINVPFARPRSNETKKYSEYKTILGKIENVFNKKKILENIQ